MNIMDFLNTSLLFTPELFILCKNIWVPKGTGAVNLLIYLFDLLLYLSPSDTHLARLLCSQP